jgi:hypothetical protein
LEGCFNIHGRKRGFITPLLLVFVCVQFIDKRT